ncbi:MAG: Gldg family protein [Synechococcales cyanobacterium M58_A2018_015]|nr:Gldg family protein [Synechococcales cyanobacterium M58_A2018_015]
MKLSFNSWQSWQKSAKYLFWLAPILLLMGLTAGIVSGSWSGVPLALLIAGGVLLLGWLIVLATTQPQFWNRRSTQVGTNALLATLAVLTILGVINFLAARYTSRLDLTENQIFTLAPQTQEIVSTLEQPVKVWIFSPNPNPADQQLLDNYRRQSNQFSYEFVDPQARPGVAREFGVQSIGEVYLEAGQTRRYIQTLSPQERLSERRLTNGLAQITAEQPQKAYFLQGHGERSLDPGQGGMSQAVSRLSEEGIVAEPLNLAANPQIPDDARALILAGPQRPLLPAELTALQNYLKRQSGLLLLIDPQTNPQLDSLLQPWGVTVSDRLVTDPAGQTSGLGPGVVIVNQYGDHPITRGFGNGISFFPLVRPLQIAPVEGVQAVPLLITSDRTQAQRIGENGELQVDPATDPQGPFDIGAAFSRTVESQPTPSPSPSPSPSPQASPSPAPSPQASPSPSPQASPSPSPAAEEDAEETTPEARLVVIGSSSFATDGLFEQQLNGDVFLNAVSWLSQQDDQVLAIRPKEVTNRRIVMSWQQQMSAGLLALAILPLLGFGTAAVIWWKRR